MLTTQVKTYRLGRYLFNFVGFFFIIYGSRYTVGTIYKFYYII